MEVLNQRPDIKELVKSVAREHSIHNPKITNVQTNEKGEGYLGEIFMITVKDATNEKSIQVVVKAAFKDETVRKLVPIDKSFLNEIYFYTEIYPAFKNFERVCGISQPIDFVPKCYKTINEQGISVLICLENLKASKFEVLDKTLTLTHDHVKIIFEMYGRFHAYSFALQDQKPEEYARLVSNNYNILNEFISNPNGHFKKHMKNFSKLVESALVPGKDDRLIEKFKKYTGDGIVEQLIEIVTGKSDYSVILHGDCWSNNMMFKYEGSTSDKKPVDMRLLDMQLIGEGSPVKDLSYCLYSGASKNELDNLNEYLKIYYESFSSFLRKLGSDPQKLFPFEVLEEHWKKYSKFGMMMALAILKMKETKKEDIIDFSGEIDENKIMDTVAQVKFNREGYKRRTKELLQHMVERDVL